MLVGNAALMADWTIAADQRASAFAQQGKTPLFISIDGEAAGIIAVADTIRSESPAAIDALKREGLRVVMLTGDNEQTAQAIAKQAGIDEVSRACCPKESWRRSNGCSRKAGSWPWLATVSTMRPR